LGNFNGEFSMMKNIYLMIFKNLLFSIIIVCFTPSLETKCYAQIPNQSGINVKMITDEADAALRIIVKKKYNAKVSKKDWQRLFSSEGYIRLKKREASLNRSFTDDEFKTFILSANTIERCQILKKTLDELKSTDLIACANKAFIYLPEGSKIQAKIYSMIKPKENSFVFEVSTDPAIFVFINPSNTKEIYENIFTHEFHHIGFGSYYSHSVVSKDIDKLPDSIRTVFELIGAFGEGFAMLAAAGGPDIHPHAVSNKEDKMRWDKDITNFNNDLKKVEKFFFDILENRLSQDEIQKTASSFFGIQGPWYTVGWKMSVVIEKMLGRSKLIECISDSRKLLPTYNQVVFDYNRIAKDSITIWAQSLIRILENK
jgi:hypothetical protein